MTAKKKDPKLDAAYRQVLQAVRRDSLGGDRQIELWQTINEALVAGAVGTRWKITDRALGLEFTEDDVTLRDANVLKQRTGLTVETADPLRDATVYQALCFSKLVNERGMDTVDAERLVGDIGVNAAAANISVVVVSPDPKERSGTESTTST